MKGFSKGLLSGILIVIVATILMASTQTYSIQKESGKFEIHMTKNNYEKNTNGFLLNTQTGETWYLLNNERKKMVEK